jgi:hypothetical protein
LEIDIFFFTLRRNRNYLWGQSTISCHTDPRREKKCF